MVVLNNFVKMHIEKKFLFVAALVTLSDLLLWRAGIGAIVFLLVAGLACVVGVIAVVINRGNSFAKFGNIAVAGVTIAVLSFAVGWMQDRLIERRAFALALNVEKYRLTHGKYPLPGTLGFFGETIRGYRIQYANPDGGRPIVVFDKFNYRSQAIDIPLQLLEPEKDI